MREEVDVEKENGTIINGLQLQVEDPQIKTLLPFLLD